MKKVIWLVSLVVMAWLLARCDFEYIPPEDGSDAGEASQYDATANEPDESPPEPDEASPPEPDIGPVECDVAPCDNGVDEWAPGCNPPWPDKTNVTCTIPEEKYFIDFCQLVWDKQECTASCWANDTQTFPFKGASAEAVSTYCHPI